MLHCGGADLVAVGMSANGDGLRPTRNKSGNVLANDWLTEDCATEDVPNGSIGALPHLLEIKFCGGGG